MLSNSFVIIDQIYEDTCKTNDSSNENREEDQNAKGKKKKWLRENADIESKYIQKLEMRGEDFRKMMHINMA